MSLIHPSEVPIYRPAKTGAWVYILRQDVQLVYIGSTGRLDRRLARHRKEKFGLFDSISGILCADRSAAYKLEAELINRHLPSLNRLRQCCPVEDLEPELEVFLLRLIA